MSTVIKYSPEELEREFGEDESAQVATHGAMGALAASVGALDYVPPPRPDYLKEDDIEAVGCQFMDAANVLMERKDCPADLRHLALAIAGLSGGDYENFTSIPQAKIGERLGVSRSEVHRRMEALYDWQRNHACTLVQVREQELEFKAGDKPQFGVTQYRPIIVAYAAKLIRIIEGRRMRPINKQNAQAALVSEVADQAIDEVADELPYADLERRNKKEKNVTPKQTQMRFIEGAEENVRRAIARWRKALEQSHYTPDPDEMIAKLMEWVNTPTERRDNFRQ